MCLKLVCCLLFAKQVGKFLQAPIQFCNRAVAIAQPGVEFAFAQGEDVRAEIESLPVEFSKAHLVVLLNRNAPASFLKRLQPEGLRDVNNRLGQAVQRCRPGIQSRRQGLPPGVKQRTKGSEGAFADLGAHFVVGGALA